MSLRRRAARFNRRFANRIAGRILPRFPGFGVIYHRGRKSGRQYRTPVKLFRSGERYLISLPYGADSDWVRNVLAAGGCDLVAGRRRVHLVAPSVFVDPAPADLPAFIRIVQRRLGITEHLIAEPAGTLTRRTSEEGHA
jgi:deazaflavin-dependent oxidoreductase (nitroreductase family)